MTARAQKEYMDYCMITQGYDNSGKEDGITQGIAIGEKRGKEQGSSEAKLEAARNLLIENIPEDVIARCTGLSLETVQQLARFAEAESTEQV